MKQLLFASFKVSHKITRCKTPHTIGEELILPAAFGIVVIMFGNNFDEQFQLMPLSNNNLARRIHDIAEDVQQ